MRKFLISFQQFPDGDVIVSFSKEGELVQVDLTESGMTGNPARWMFRKFPLTLNDFFEMAQKSGWKFAEVSFEVSFEEWWKLYNNKINKKRCIPIWDKLPKLKQIEIYYNTKDYNTYLAFESWRSKSDPEGYLKKQMYDTDWKELLDQAKRKRIR